MKLTMQFLEEKSACSDGVKWWVDNGKPGTIEKTIKLLLAAEKYDWCNWLLTRTFTKKQCVWYAVFAARKALAIYEEKYPADDRPRLAIEAAEKWIANPSQKTRAAAEATWAGAEAAWATRAARAAAWAARAAAEAARAAAGAEATWAGAEATWAVAEAAWAAEAAAAAAEATRAVAEAAHKKIINYGLKILTGV